MLLNLLKAQLNINAVKRKTKRGRFITCISIRQVGHNFPLLISEEGDDLAKGDDLVTTLVTAESTVGDEGDDLLPKIEKLTEGNTINQWLLPNSCDQNEADRSSPPSPSSLARVSGHCQVVTRSSPNQSQVVTNQPETVIAANPGNVEILGGDDTQSLTQQILSNWDDPQALGEIILAIADTDQLRKEVRDYTTENLKHIKDAANQAWKPGCNSYGEYCGEKVELWDFGSNTRDWKVRSLNGGSIISAARGNVRPWLGV